ncbi:SixA phosphatase family protein [Cecembia lonarensis]|uniref:Phosphohistidine phosphatase SixA n=1 Tax=Cecembia lonarensis (strain CCUG 58316 / KCTC 22772 / LW9) TaxID=1225176 RepID=K1LV25_CECL9|nr:histidine phosphatase family protein [Cecembia lonarensis]EKB47999.1 phosphohistidine phosphatase SixA [Cecembia lonarensis LW9]
MEINKVLFLLRHGEAALSSVSGRDFDRPLKESGEKQLHRLSKTLKNKGLYFDLVLCSNAVRTLETEKIIEKYLPVKEAYFLSDLYEANPSKMLDLINGTSDEVRNLLIIGHNPGISALAAYLSGDNFINLRPGMMTKLDLFQSNWNMVGNNTGHLTEVLY